VLTASARLQQQQQCDCYPLPLLPSAFCTGRGARAAALNEDEAAALRGLGLLTLKPLIYAANVGEDDLGDKGARNEHVAALRARAAEDGCEVVVVSAKVGMRESMCMDAGCLMHILLSLHPWCPVTSLTPPSG
jgi:hypothetical protein